MFSDKNTKDVTAMFGLFSTELLEYKQTVWSEQTYYNDHYRAYGMNNRDR